MRIIGEKRKTRRTATVTASGELSLEKVLVMLTSGSADMLSSAVSSAYVLYKTWWVLLMMNTSMEPLMLVLFTSGVVLTVA